MQNTSNFLENSGTLKDDILKIVSDLIQNGRIILIEELYNIARKQTSAERLAIENVIDRLIQQKYIVPGSRITRQIILHNPTRRRIYEFVKLYPGVNVNTVKKSLTLGSNSALWHIGVLVQFGCLQELIYRTSKIYAQTKLAPRDVLFRFLMRKELVRSIFSAIAQQPSSLAELARSLGVDKAKIAYHLNILQELNFIEKSIEGENPSIIKYKILYNTETGGGVKNTAGESPVKLVQKSGTIA